MVEEEQGMVMKSVLFLVTVLVGAAAEVGEEVGLPVEVGSLVAVAEAEGVTEYFELSVQLQSSKVRVVASVTV